MSESEVLEHYRQRITRDNEDDRELTHIDLNQNERYGPLSFPALRVQALWFASEVETDEEPGVKWWTTDPSLIDLLDTVRRYGAELYRRNQIYRALERPEPIISDVALQRHRHLVFLGVSGSGKTSLLCSFARQSASHPEKPLPMIEGFCEDHDLVREAAAEHLIRLGGDRTLHDLLSTLQHDHWRVRRMAAIVARQLADRVHDPALLNRAARALWWRLTDKEEVARAAFQALDMIVMRMSTLRSSEKQKLRS